MILAFSGREHHSQKLMPVVTALRNKGTEVNWLIANNAINIDSPMKYMRPSGEKFIHAYAQMMPGNDDLIDTIVQELLEQVPRISGVSPFWYVYSIREMAEVLVSFSQLMVPNKVEAILVLHTNNFWAKPLAWLAQREGIPVYAFQEGILRERDQSTMDKQGQAAEFCSKLFVWGQSAKKAYIKAGVKSSQIVVAGPPQLDRYHEIKRDTVQQALGNRPVVVFSPTSGDEYIGSILEDAQFLKRAATGLGMHFMFSPHPFETEFYKEHIAQLNTVNVGDKLLLAKSGSAVFVGQHSTVMLEALALGALVIEYQKDGEEILQPISKHGAAFSAKQTTLFEMLNGITGGTVSLQGKDVRRYLKDHVGERVGQVSEFIANTILKEVAKNG